MKNYQVNNGINNRIIYNEKTFNFLGININGDNNLIQIGDYNNISPRNCSIDIKGHYNKIIINDNISIKGMSISIVGNNNLVFIGNNTSFNNKCEIYCSLGKSIHIGEDCIFSKNISISTSDIYTLYDIKTDEIINPPQNIYIGDHVWICEECFIQKGSKVLDDSIVEAYSIVNKEFTEKNILIAGQPAQILKKNINWDKRVNI